MSAPHSSLYYADDAVSLHVGDATDVLSTLPDASVDCVVTSPPYWGLRDYGTGRWVGGDPAWRHSVGGHRSGPQPTVDPRSGACPQRCSHCWAIREDHQHGLEPTPQDYVKRLRDVFAEVRRVLVDTGTVWLNLGDSFSAELPGRTAGDAMRASTLSGAAAASVLRESVRSAGVRRTRVVPRKNLLGMPWRVAFALQEDGWILRNAIVWHKPNAMPESVRDRLSIRYEMLFLLVKQKSYFFDLDPIREPLVRPEALRENLVIGGVNKGHHAGVGATARRRGHSIYGKYSPDRSEAGVWHGAQVAAVGRQHSSHHPRGKNPGDVWSLPTRPLREAHFAAYPIDIPLRAIAAGCPPQGVVLDPFSGAATTGLAARELGRYYLGIDLNPEFHEIGLRRLGIRRGEKGEEQSA
jgi:DNA modification methylase